MPSTAEQAIYNRLASAPSFHPASAELLLNDWTLEPGDVVTVKSGESNYNLPIYSLNLNWTGSNIGGAENSNTTRITIESTGNKEREPLPELRRKQFEQDRFAYGGFRAQQQEIDEHYQHVVEVTDQGMSDAFGILGVSIGADGMPAKDSSGNYIWDDSGTGGEIWGHLNRNAWTSVVQNHIQDANGNILSIGQVLTGADGQVLIQAINDQRTGTATINADRISISGDVKLSGALGIDNGNLWVKRAAVFGSQGGSLVTINNGYVQAPHLQVNSGGSLTVVGSGSGQYKALGYSDFMDFVTGFGQPTEDNGQISIPYYKVGIPPSSPSVPSINFNIASTQFYLDGVEAAWNDAADSLELTDGYQDIADEEIYLSYDQVYEVYARVPYHDGQSYSEKSVTIYAPAEQSFTFDKNELNVNIGSDSDPWAYSPSKRVGNISGYIGVSYGGVDYGSLRSFSISVPYVSSVSHDSRDCSSDISVTLDYDNGSRVTLTSRAR